MVVRIRLSRSSGRGSLKGRIRRTAMICAALLTPAALMAWALAGWRLMADMKWTSEFAIQDGLFSHWQVWVAVGIGVQFVAFTLGRIGREDDARVEVPATGPLTRHMQAGGR